MSKEFLTVLGALVSLARALDSVSHRVMGHFGAQNGTLHFLDLSSGLLHPAASRGIAPSLRERIEPIPVGKGMVGLPVER